VKAKAAAPDGLAEELFAAQQQNAALRRRISELEQQGVAAAPSGSADELFAAQQQNAALRRRMSELEQQLNQARARIADLERQLAAPKAAPLGPARGSVAQLETAKQGLVRALRPEIEKGDITVDLNNERLLIKLASSYLFGSGEAGLKPGGADALKKVGEILKDFPEYNVSVEGHTDNRPIRSTLRKKFATNQDLSEARAANAAKALREGGLSNVSQAGYADTRPVASNTTEEGRAQNRRVEIRVTK
jgi:chemotaxis protein MotB